MAIEIQLLITGSLFLVGAVYSFLLFRLNEHKSFWAILGVCMVWVSSMQFRTALRRQNIEIFPDIVYTTERRYMSLVIAVAVAYGLHGAYKSMVEKQKKLDKYDTALTVLQQVNADLQQLLVDNEKRYAEGNEQRK